MIRLGLRLTLGSGREALYRVLVVAGAVALGVSLLLATLAGANGLSAKTTRASWLDTAAQQSSSTSSASLWWLSSVDTYGAQSIDRVDVAATRPGSPVPPGIPRLPGPGQYYVSPALASLLHSVPASQLADRYPGSQVGVISAAGLPSPNSLIIVIGHHASELSHVPGAVEVSAIQRTPASCYDCPNVVGSGPVLDLVLALGAVFLLLPILVLIGTASRLSAARRQERFAAMRLVGATPRQITVVAGVEAVEASIIGVAVGFGLFFALRPLLYHVPFTGSLFAPGDLSLSLFDVLLVLLGVPIAAAVSARLALRRVQASPLSVTQRGAAHPPRATRLIPLLAGIALLAYFDVAGKPGAVQGQLLEILVGFVLLIVGVVLAGPWFAVLGGRVLAARASRPAALIAGRRVLDNSKASFRFVTGLIVALFVSSALFGALSSADAASATTNSPAGLRTLALTFCNYATRNCPNTAKVDVTPGSVQHGLVGVSGVSGVTVIHEDPSAAFTFMGAVDCAQLVRTPAIGRCAPGVATAQIGYFFSRILGHTSHASARRWPSAGMSTSTLASLPVSGVVVATNGSKGSIERARTALERAFPLQGTPVAVTSLDPRTVRMLKMIQAMIGVVIVASLIIAACSLAVNMIAGLDDRKRPFGLLRLSGAPTSLLHRVVALETLLPLLSVAVVSVAVGLLSSALYLHSQAGLAFVMPGVSYWATVLGGIAVSLVLVVLTFPVLDRITGPEVARTV